MVIQVFNDKQIDFYVKIEVSLFSWGWKKVLVYKLNNNFSTFLRIFLNFWDIISGISNGENLDTFKSQF